MDYKCYASKCLDLVKVDHKCLIVSYEFAPRNTSRKWAVERDWTVIHNAIRSFIEQNKYLRISQTEIIDISGDIQLEIRPKERPSYLATFFNYPPENLLWYYLSVFVTFGKLQEKFERLKAKTNGSKDNEIFMNTQHYQDSEGDVPVCRTPMAAVTYTPNQDIKPLNDEEYVPNFICSNLPGTRNQRKATKRKICETCETATLVRKVTPRPSTSSMQKSPVTRRTTHILESQTKDAGESGTRGLPKNDLFDSDETEETETDVELQETPIETIFVDDTTQEVAKTKKKLVLSDLVTIEPQKSKEDKEPPNLSKWLKGKPKKILSYIPMSRLLSSYKIVEKEMDEVVAQFHRTKRIPKIKDFHYTRYVDLITTEQTNAAMKFLDKRYPHSDKKSARLLTVLTEYVLPEWIMRVFMTEYKMNRQEAIDYLLKTY